MGDWFPSPRLEQTPPHRPAPSLLLCHPSICRLDLEEGPTELEEEGAAHSSCVT